jgi:hypothetical protein
MDDEHDDDEYELKPLPRAQRHQPTSLEANAPKPKAKDITHNSAKSEAKHTSKLRTDSGVNVLNERKKPTITAPTRQDRLDARSSRFNRFKKNVPATQSTADGITPADTTVRQFEPSSTEQEAHRARIAQKAQGLTPEQQAARHKRNQNSSVAIFWNYKYVRANPGDPTNQQYRRIMVEPPYRKQDKEALARVCSTLSHDREEAKARDALKDPARLRQREVEHKTPWQRFVWRMSCNPCWETSEGCFFENPGSRIRGSRHGHGDGMCVYFGCRECCCNIGCKHCAEDACCEGGGCVRCCGWTHGFWQICDDWTWGCFGTQPGDNAERDSE